MQPNSPGASDSRFCVLDGEAGAGEGRWLFHRDSSTKSGHKTQAITKSTVSAHRPNQMTLRGTQKHCLTRKWKCLKPSSR